MSRGDRQSRRNRHSPTQTFITLSFYIGFKMKNIILIGYMGAGKTSVGKVLARRLGMQFYDLDWYIEERFRKKICDLFAEKGEEGFRRIEYNLLHEVAEFEDVVLSLGGGTPCFFDNMDYLNERGITIFLDASPSTIVQHLKISHTVRPLLKDKKGDEVLDHISRQIEERKPYYTRAQLTVNVDTLDNFDKIDALVESIVKQLDFKQ